MPENSHLSAEQIYASCYWIAIAIAYRITNDYQSAEDAVQEAYVGLIKFPGKHASESLFKNIVKKRAIDWVREKKCRRKIGTTESDISTPGESSKAIPLLSTLADEKAAPPDAAAHANECHALLKSWISTLPPKEGISLGLYKIDKLSYAEIAAKLGTTENAITCRCARGLKMLRANFKHIYDELS